MAGLLTVAPERCYWAVLPATARRQSARSQQFMAEGQLPVPVEGLQFCRFDLADGRVGLAAIEAESLQAVIAAADAGPLWQVRPDGLPPVLTEVGGEIGRCNFLTGTFEPAPRRRLRLTMATVLGIGVLVIAALGGMGLWVRMAALQAETDRIDAHRLELVRAVVDATSTMHPDLQLRQALRRSAAAGDSGDAGLVDATPVVDAIWAVWPQRLRAQIETVTVSADRCVIRGRLPDMAAANQLAQAVKQLDVAGQRWDLRPPDIRQQTRPEASASIGLIWEPRAEDQP